MLPTVVAMPVSIQLREYSHYEGKEALRHQPRQMGCRPMAGQGCRLIPESGIKPQGRVGGGNMAKNTSIIIGDHFGEFIERQVSEGRYGSASDVVRAGLRLLEEREMKIKALRAALIEGEQSGTPKPFDVEAFISRKRQKRRRGSKAAA
jgi:antitoxin ParD1/3/4